MNAIDQFKALDKSTQDQILDKYRDINVDYSGWWDATCEMFKEDMASIGIEVDRMYFSGFWSQGDGACFEGRVSHWDNFLASLGYTDPVLIQHFSNHASFHVKHQGHHYYHENCVQFSYDLPLPAFVGDESFALTYGCGEELRDAVLLNVLSTYDHDELVDEFEEAFKDHMRDLYKRLEQEYDYLTSDEAVLDALCANDMLEEIIEELKAEEVAEV